MHLLIIDAMNLIRRVYAVAEKSQASLEATESRCLSIIARNAADSGATHVAMVFEEQVSTWRHDIWPDYKLGRPPMPQPLAEGLPLLRQRLTQQGLFCLDVLPWEADDVIASLAHKAASAGVSVTIVSTDKGFCQLASEHIQTYSHFDRRLYNVEGVRGYYGLLPHQLVDFWALTGDSTNHLPGVPGIGPKTAGQLLDQFQTLDALLVQLDDVPERWQTVLQQHWRDALLTRLLARLRLDVPLGVNLHDLRWRSFVR